MTGPDQARLLAAVVVDSVLAGAIYALIALAFVVYKASRIINFALGEWVMLGSRLAAAGAHPLGLGLAGALVAACAGMVALAVVWNRVVLRRLVGQPLISMIMVTIGFGALVRGAAALSFRGIPGTIPLPFPQEPLPPLGFPVPADRLAAVTCCFRESRTGLALRAIADDQQAAMAVGIDIDRHFSITWALVGVLCVLAGTLWASVSGGEFGRVLLGIK